MKLSRVHFHATFSTILILTVSVSSLPQHQDEEDDNQNEQIEDEEVILVKRTPAEEQLFLMADQSFDKDAGFVNVPFINGDGNCQCGMPSARIVNGEDAQIDQYPWIAVLYAVESPKYKIAYCGATLINNLYLLTASHCVDGMNPAKLEVVLREENITDTSYSDENVIRVGVDKFIAHPKYSRTTQDNDIALIKLKKRVSLNEILKPICVPTAEATFAQGLSATVAGWGAISEAGTPTSTLQKAEVRVLSNELCNAPPYHRGKVTDNMLCADGNGKGPCAGDTGGPLMIKTSKNLNRQGLAGIASWSTTCNDPTRPAVYTRVSGYESWILENTRDAYYCGN